MNDNQETMETRLRCVVLIELTKWWNISERRSGKTDQNLNFVARVEKSISFIFLFIDSSYVDKKPNVDCSCQKPFICEKN